MKKIITIVFLALFVASCSTKQDKISTWTVQNNSTWITQTWVVSTDTEDKTILYDKNLKEMQTNKKLENGDVVAFIKTTKWQIEIFLEMKKAPITSANFIWLAKKWYYNWTTFHRVIKDFMIQWGDPLGNWTGWESIYWKKFKDEFDKDLKNNTYTISMANSWANTNWSQFFINVNNNNYLDFKHSVFGEVIWWRENVLNISKVKTWAWDKPEKEVKIISIEIKKYEDGKFVDYSFDEKKVVDDYNKAQEESKNSPIKSWDKVSVHYKWTFENGQTFDDSYSRWTPISFTVWAWQMISGFDEAVVWMKVWDKKSIVLPPEKAYGKRDENQKQIIKKADLKEFTDAWIKLEKWTKLPTQLWELEIIDTNEETVTIDINHPMAWKTLKFDIELVDKK